MNNPNDQLDCSDMDNATDAERRRQRIPRFKIELTHLLNRVSMENVSGTPDFLLAQYLTECLLAYEKITVARDAWHAPEA